MKNKANFNLGKIGVSYYLTSKYGRIQGVGEEKNKANFIVLRHAYCVIFSPWHRHGLLKNVCSLKTA